MNAGQCQMATRVDQGANLTESAYMQKHCLNFVCTIGLGVFVEIFVGICCMTTVM